MLTYNNDFKNVKMILFASLIAVMILPFSGMNQTLAEEQAEKNDKELIAEYDKLFGESVEIKDPINSDAGISTYAPLEGISDEMKIDVMKKLREAKTSDEYDVFIEQQVQERAPLLKIVSNLLELIQTTQDPQDKAILLESLHNLRPLMAKHGIFLEEDKRNSELIDIWAEDKSETQEENLGTSQGAHHMIQQIYQWFQILLTPSS